jgi:hypothetical protein
VAQATTRTHTGVEPTKQMSERIGHVQRGTQARQKKSSSHELGDHRLSDRLRRARKLGDERSRNVTDRNRRTSQEQNRLNRAAIAHLDVGCRHLPIRTHTRLTWKHNPVPAKESQVVRSDRQSAKQIGITLP